MHDRPQTVRRAAVAGSFYPGDENTLRQQLTRLLADQRADAPEPGSTAKVLIVPHAGYVYSGAIAARAYAGLEAQRASIRRVLLLGPAHRVYLQGMALPSVAGFSTPLGDVALDRGAINEATRLPHVVVNDAAHELEHSLEVQLPFLQAVLEKFTLIPVVVGDTVADDVAALIDALWGGPETLIVVSTDLSHFHGYDAAQELDARTCERILSRATDLDGEEACGARVLNGLLSSAHIRDYAIELLARCNSGDTAGDRARVVGYGAFAVH